MRRGSPPDDAPGEVRADAPAGRAAPERREALEFGREAEAWVARALAARGWAVLDRNWHGEHGELDLVVARDAPAGRPAQDGVVRVVEVKARAPGDAGALEAVDPRKRALLRRTAEAWLVARDARPVEVAFLVVAVERGPDGLVGEWLDDAF